MTVMTAPSGGTARRLVESGTEATAVLGATALPAAWPALDGGLVAVLAGMLVVITGAIYALHTVTFDLLRLVPDRARGKISFTHGEE
ncbi:hypothetical protein [Symbioplanes lichenis]|uniref:hypothetical protein n=1 Tax=Symbioplanes lichenis TaxID=1629072 RepID=UPI0027384080|nr:hypothetical protein [Actinoplanes lichenis]